MQLVNLVLYECGVHIEVPSDILGVQDVIVEVDFKTGVGHRTYVHRNLSVTERTGNRLVVKHVARLTREVLDATIELVLEQTKVNTDIEGGLGLPCQILVTLVGQCTVRETRCITSHCKLVEISIVVADGIVTLLAE